jgi:hypothetical protein
MLAPIPRAPDTAKHLMPQLSGYDLPKIVSGRHRLTHALSHGYQASNPRSRSGVMNSGSLAVMSRTLTSPAWLRIIASRRVM